MMLLGRFNTKNGSPSLPKIIFKPRPAVLVTKAMCNCFNTIKNSPEILDHLNSKVPQKKRGTVVRAEVKHYGWFGKNMQTRILLTMIGKDANGSRVAEVPLVATYCPFCGEKYVKDQPLKEAIGTGD